jgi:ribosomal protein L37AE/L43A
VPSVTTTPKTLKPYIFHGLTVEYREDADEAMAECPFCGKHKMSIKVETGLWRCLVCATGSSKGGGNLMTFLKLLWQESEQATKDYASLAADRGLLSQDTLISWGVCRSILTDEWLVPGYNHQGVLTQLYRYVLLGGKFRLLATPEINHGLFLPSQQNKHASTVWVCEGIWDAMALWELLRITRREDHHLVETANMETSLLAEIGVVGTPGANVFREAWAAKFADKSVVLAYDNDHPVVNNGKSFAPVGVQGMRHATQVMVSGSEGPPRSVGYVRWNKEGDHDPELANGYDLRDCLRDQTRSGGDTAAQRIRALYDLFGRVQPAPDEWLKGHGGKAKGKGDTSLQMELLPCESWRLLTNACRKALKWTEGMDRALSVMLASVASMDLDGDQLWVKIISPPSGGKSTLCECLSVNKTYIVAKSIIRGFHSGFQSDKGSKDNSLLAQLNGKTLVTKDGDTLLQAPNRSQILAEARDVYDGNSRTHYRHGIDRDYEGVRMTWILCGTESLRELDTSELGERFLDCIIMEHIDPKTEGEINRRAARRILDSRGRQANGTPESRQDIDTTQMMQLCGGYITYLRSNAPRLFQEVVVTPEVEEEIEQYALFVAYMRARENKKQDEKIGREMSTRLYIQLLRLSLTLAVVLNRKAVDHEVMRRVRLVALDTARGKMLNIARALYEEGQEGTSIGVIALGVDLTEVKVREYLRFLRILKVVELFTPETRAGKQTRSRWRLSPEFHTLYEQVAGQGNRKEHDE